MTMPLHLTCYHDLKAWVKKHRRLVLVAASLAGGGAIVYYGTEALGLVSQVKTKKEKDPARSTILQKEAEDRADTQYICCLPILDRFIDYMKLLEEDIIGVSYTRFLVYDAVKLQSHFQGIQKISDSTTLPSVLAHLKASLFAQVNLSGLTEKLMIGKGDPQTLSSKEKMQLWHELKTLSFTRTVCAMWAVSLLDIFIRIQLNILGRHMYFDTAKDMLTSEEMHVPLSMSCQHKFIAFAGYLPKKGVQSLVTDTRVAVDSVLKGKALKEPQTIDDLRALFMRIRATLDSRRARWDEYVLPVDNVFPKDLAKTSSDAAEDLVVFDSCDGSVEFEQLMLETRAVLASNELHEVLAICLDAMLDGVMEELYTVFIGATDSGIPLAKLLPPVAGSGSSLLEHPDDNLYIQRLASLPQVQAFCALVYTNASTGAGL